MGSNNCLMLIFTAMSGIGAFTAVIATVCVFYRQKKIALFDRRMQILNDFENFVFNVLPNWEWQGQTNLITKYSEKEVVALFNEEYGELQKDIIKTADSCNMLIGDIEHARSHGVCHNKTDFELEEEKTNLEKELQTRFSEKRGKAYEKWLKI